MLGIERMVSCSELLRGGVDTLWKQKAVRIVEEY
ncbi:hypothetical protein NBRC3279_1714 [Acetobacter pasteurianus NBRC 3279]|nr:hypothetical protein NBRC3279_1714 [Acetobacter pasteurianus NBRC 3279]GCD72531.1 hypothetical protein NBRC3284_1687 [Acetobacter pasteurianus NBRC 3284]